MQRNLPMRRRFITLLVIVLIALLLALLFFFWQSGRGKVSHVYGLVSISSAWTHQQAVLSSDPLVSPGKRNC
jgi:uncharacterized membrane protein